MIFHYNHDIYYVFYYEYKKRCYYIFYIHIYFYYYITIIINSNIFIKKNYFYVILIFQVNIYKSNVRIFDINVSFQLGFGFCKQSINSFIFLFMFSYLNVLFLSQQTWNGKLFIFGVNIVNPFTLLTIISLASILFLLLIYNVYS